MSGYPWHKCVWMFCFIFKSSRSCNLLKTVAMFAYEYIARRSHRLYIPLFLVIFLIKHTKHFVACQYERKMETLQFVPSLTGFFHIVAVLYLQLASPYKTSLCGTDIYIYLYMLNMILKMYIVLWNIHWYEYSNVQFGAFVCKDVEYVSESILFCLILWDMIQNRESVQWKNYYTCLLIWILNSSKYISRYLISIHM